MIVNTSLKDPSVRLKAIDATLKLIREGNPVLGVVNPEFLLFLEGRGELTIDRTVPGNRIGVTVTQPPRPEEGEKYRIIQKDLPGYEKCILVQIGDRDRAAGFWMSKGSKAGPDWSNRWFTNPDNGPFKEIGHIQAHEALGDDLYAKLLEYTDSL